MRKKWLLFLPLGLAFLFAAIGGQRLLQYEEYHGRELENLVLQRSLRTGDELEDPTEAIAHYAKIRPMIPEIQLRILQRQWTMALEMLHEIQAARYNPKLEAEVSALFARLTDHLDAMKARCSALVSESAPLAPEIAWRIYNISGCAGLLKTFCVLETEGNWKKISSMLKDALADLKAAIEQVDLSHTPTYEKNIPRWNVELLYGEDLVRKLAQSSGDTERRLELKDNLEAIIPEKGGYAPGEPVDRTIQK